MMQRHTGHPCTPATAERYMHHMGAALEAVPEIDADSKARLTQFFRWVGSFTASM